MQAPRGRTYSSYSFLTSTLDGGEWSTSRPGRALPRGIWRSYRTHNKVLIVKQVVAAYSGHWALNRKGTWVHVCFFLCFGWNVALINFTYQRRMRKQWQKWLVWSVCWICLRNHRVLIMQRPMMKYCSETSNYSYKHGDRAKLRDQIGQISSR
jgi:hypothetical protein